MKFFRTVSALTAISVTSLAASAGAATDEQRDSHHPAATPTVQATQVQPGITAPGMGNMKSMAGGPSMPGMEAQMKTMREMHDKMLAANTPEQRNALMAEHMKIMQNGMSMMGDMGPGAMMAKPGDMAARQGMLEQRMDMMQSMMQMMMDRMQSVPATK